ncbi:Establishment of cohesion 1, partial [Nowakowskiella sp. JEL0078]
RIILISNESSSGMKKKLSQVMEVVQMDLGAVALDSEKLKTFLYIKDKIVIGCVVSEPVSFAQRLKITEVNGDSDKHVCTVSDEKIPVICGVSRIWVSPLHRRNGIATVLLDSLRSNFVFGTTIEKDKLAFSQPTDAGQRLASSYISRQDFLVYKDT